MRHGRDISRRIQLGLPLVLALVPCTLAGCGETEPGTATSPTAAAHRHTTTTKGAQITPSSADPKPPSPAAAGAKPGPQSVVARVDAASDRALAEGKLKVAAGAPSDVEVRHELELARKAGIPVPSGDSAQSFENDQSGTGPAVYAQTPEAPWNPQAKPIADWIVPILEWAYAHGWHGTVTSGYRTFYEQARLNAAGAYSAPAGLSNHETTVYPGGAVDVSDPSQLLVVLRGYSGPHRLVGGVLGPIDPEHFSATGD